MFGRGAKAAGIAINELIDGKIFGTVPLPGGNSPQQDDEPAGWVSLQVGGQTLGRRRIEGSGKARSGFLGRSAAQGRFTLPFHALASLVALTGRRNELEIILRGYDHEARLNPPPEQVSALSEPRSLLLIQEGKALRLTDIWFAAELELRLRFEPLPAAEPKPPAGPLMIRFYQPQWGAALTLQKLAEIVHEADALKFITVPLINPLFPVLLTVTAGDELLDIDIVALPSLCRGGLHNPEFAELAPWGDYLADLAAVSDSMLRELVGWPDGPGRRSIGLLRIVGAGEGGKAAAGVPAVREWIERIVEMPVETVVSGPGAADGQTGPLVLTIASDTIPTISALVARRLDLGGAPGPAAYSLLVADKGTTESSWFVRIPGSEVVQQLQPFGVEAQPSVSLVRGDTTVEATIAAPIPLAIRTIATTEPSEEDRFFPIGRDVKGSVLGQPRGQPDAAPERISAIVPLWGGRDPTQILETLAKQTLADKLEVLLIDNRADAGLVARMAELMTGLFRKRGRVIGYDKRFNHSAMLNFGAEQATGDFLLLADNDVALHDERTLATLHAMAEKPGVASASCTLLYKRFGTVSFRSAGLFPTNLSLSDPSQLVFSALNCEIPLAKATYPVAASALALALIRRDTWARLGGLDASILSANSDEVNYGVRANSNEIDFGLRALKLGYVNLCTTAVTALHQGRLPRGHSFDVTATRYVAGADFGTIFSSVTMLRKLS